MQNWYSTNDNYSVFAADYFNLYVNTVKDEIQQNDDSRTVLVSSPSNGVIGESDNFTISKNPQDVHFGDGE